MRYVASHHFPQESTPMPHRVTPFKAVLQDVWVAILAVLTSGWALVCSAWALLLPVHTVLGAMVLLVFGDAVLGMWAARKRGERLTSEGWRRTGSKLLLYPLTCLVMYGLESLLLAPLIPLIHSVPVVGAIVKAFEPYPLAKMTGGWLVLTELVSMAENVDTILGREVFGGIVHRIAPVKILGALVDKLSAGNPNKK